MADVAAAVGIDLGGTRIKAGLVSEGRVVKRDVVHVADARDEDAIVARLAELAGGLGDADTPVGVAVAGVLDADAGVIRESPNFPAWRDFALARRLSARLGGRTVRVDNDANAVILGEALAGAGRGARGLIGFTLGTGVGGAVILGGQLWRGERGMAGELGHITVVPNGRPCPCGNRGCLEQYAGQVGLRQSMREAGGALAELAATQDAPRQLSAQAAAGDPAACAIYAAAGEALGQVAAGLLHALDVRIIVLAGGVTAAAPWFVPTLEATLTSRMFASMRDGVEVRVGTLGDDAGVIGASAVASALEHG